MKNPVLALIGLFMAMPATVAAYPAGSRRAALAQMRTQVTQLVKDESGEHNPVQKIAIGFILLAVALVIALAVLPLILDSVAAAQASANITGSSKTLLGLIPLLVVVGLLAGSLSFLIAGFRDLKTS